MKRRVVGVYLRAPTMLIFYQEIMEQIYRKYKKVGTCISVVLAKLMGFHFRKKDILD